MADEIKGTAILHWVDVGNGVKREYLMVCCVGAPPRKTRFGMIPVRPEGTAESVSPGSWQYRLNGETIHVHPSVRLSARRPLPGREAEWPQVGEPVELFHNGTPWSVRFLRFEDQPAAEKADGAYMLWRRLNAEFLVDEAD